MNTRLAFGLSLLFLASACGPARMTDAEMAAFQATLHTTPELCPRDATPDELNDCFRGVIAKKQYEELVSYCGKKAEQSPARYVPSCVSHVVVAMMLGSRVDGATKLAREICDSRTDDALYRVDYVAEISVVALRALSERSIEAGKQHQSFVVERTLAHADACKVPRMAVAALMKQQGAELKASGSTSSTCATTPACTEALAAAKH